MARRAQLNPGSGAPGIGLHDCRQFGFADHRPGGVAHQDHPESFVAKFGPFSDCRFRRFEHDANTAAPLLANTWNMARPCPRLPQAASATRAVDFRRNSLPPGEPDGSPFSVDGKEAMRGRKKSERRASRLLGK
jgi:hypothetical protein